MTMTQAIPQTIYLKDYQAPDYAVDAIDLVFTLGEDVSIVKANMTIRANPSRKTTDLSLQGEKLDLQSITLNDKKLTPNDYHVDETSLTLFGVPDAFTLTIETRLKPQENTALSGLYKSSGNFCTQCEAEGFRWITYFLFLQDVMTL